MQVVWYWSITLTKLSVALLLLRLKPGRYWKLFLHSTIALLLLTVCVQTCFQFLQCRPFAVYWDPRLLRGVKCIPRAVINGNIIANSTVHVATDLVFSFMPITFISKLHRPRGEKIFLSILMGLGLFASTFAILRTAGLANLYVERDFLKMNVMPTLWASLEQEVALIAATIPTLKNFMQRVLVRVGQYCYEEESEMRVKSKLMQMGWLGVGDVDEGAVRMGRKPSKPDIESEVLTFGSPRVGKRRDEFGDSILVVEKEVAVETVVGGKGRDVGLERIGAGRGKEYGV
ncbi:hypothetical protein CC86DRAFT_370139 [Ophiobolus disseminans]|uniref:Rhodopsin domain-containing protein n=1 Tax=Ophiobolus disseminans TaxID=1469910 RepID=A0A6A7A2P4_9PLEO|nr:hypothetical protein CC86DRAFT_370139 [Ophiobolus disseminans]